jgi:hypothetical protein
MCAKAKDDHMSNICTIFKKVREKVHPQTGKKIAEHWCLICKYILIIKLNMFLISDIFLRNKGVKTYLFTGGIFSLHTHILRYCILFID